MTGFFNADIKNVKGLIAMLALAFVASGVTTAAEQDIESGAEQLWSQELEGIASWYAGKFQGRLTANGERFDTNLMTAAHKTLPFNTVVQVTNLDNGLVTVVRINDRGPFVDNRVIDLSRAAADAIDMTHAGIAPVRLEILYLGENNQWTVIQIASYSVHENARRTRARLEEAGLPVEFEYPDPQTTRVIIRNVRHEEVPTLRAQLADLGFQSILVRRSRSLVPE